jgi:hypothetical protein
MRVGYEDKFIRARDRLLHYCSNIIKDSVGENFYEWLTLQADVDFGMYYVKVFKDEFKEETTDNSERQLLFAAKNLVYAIDAYMTSKPSDETEVQYFAGNFIRAQMDSFNSWCDIGTYHGHV